jgi:GNAT superfamily N-acetyltransferase
MLVQAEPVVLDSFPKTLTLEDGLTVCVRPLQASDEQALRAFFQTIPDEERYWLREDVSDASVIRRWVADLDYSRVLPLLAFHDEAIVADGTLHRRGHGARRYLGEIRLVVTPAYRGRGLGYLLINELIEVAQSEGLERLEAEIVSGAQAPAMEAVGLIGFEQVAVLPNHLRGPYGDHHDLFIFTYPLQD